MKRVIEVTGCMGYWLASFLAIAVALVSYRFVPLGVAESMAFIAHHLEGKALSLYGHVAVAPVALALMPFQFRSRLRQKRPALHRWMGRLYVAAVFVSGFAGFHLAFSSSAGAVASAGFALLAILWIGTTGAALVFAVKQQFNQHKAWMLRSAALTFAAVTLRVFLASAEIAGLEFNSAYSVIAWVCWLPNLLVVELYLAVSRRRFPTRIAPEAA
jgi:hypothetical protein